MCQVWAVSEGGGGVIPCNYIRKNTQNQYPSHWRRRALFYIEGGSVTRFASSSLTKNNSTPSEIYIYPFHLFTYALICVSVLSGTALNLFSRLGSIIVILKCVCTLGWVNFLEFEMTVCGSCKMSTTKTKLTSFN